MIELKHNPDTNTSITGNTILLFLSTGNEHLDILYNLILYKTIIGLIPYQG